MQDNTASQEFLSGLVCEGVVQQDVVWRCCVKVLCFGVLCDTTLQDCGKELEFVTITTTLP